MVHIAYAKEAETFIPDKHFGCSASIYFRKGQPSMNVSVARSDFREGGRADWHKHSESDQAYYVLRGKVRVWVDGEDTYADLGVGDMVLFPMGSMHKLLNIGNEQLSVLAINCPAL